VAHLDLYSCFASSVLLACDALGIDPAVDGRTFTVTGGLPFAGGAGSGYVLHSLASMVEVLRADPGSLGLVSGVGMHLTKHAYGVYSTTPPAGPAASVVGADATVQARLDATPTVAITDRFDGEATIASYTVAHGRDGAAQSALVLADLPDGSRAYGRATDADLLAALEADEWVGRTVHLESEGDVNVVTA
jgi:acetyl-CoA C-acetyltransferase